MNVASTVTVAGVLYTSEFSIVVALVSLAIGVIAFILAIKFNRDTSKMLDDMEYIMSRQLRMLDVQKRMLKKLNRDLDTSAKDELVLHKLSTYKKSDVGKIMECISQMSIKRRFLPYIEAFLKSGERNYSCDFWGHASGSETMSVAELYDALIEYGIVVQVNYY